MTILAKIDRIDTMDMTVRHGAIVSLTRRMRVINLTSTDWTVMIQAMDQAGIPEDQSILIEAPNLILVEKRITLLPNDKSAADVDCIYEHILNDGQEFGNPPLGATLVRLRTTAAETESNKDVDGNAVTLAHKFPSDDKDHPDQTITQGGKFKVYQMQQTLRVEGLKQHNKPYLIPPTIVGRVNSVPFAGRPARTWLCTACDIEPFDATPPIRAKFAFEFQHNPDTWDATVYFVDSRNGLPPVNLVPGTGVKTVRTHKEVDFQKILGTEIQGA